uniref:Late nodulin domain-containing protein n=1 Tax=Medicago truncatula TaxID=3880 RepID=I3SJU2_MEDTR|nr:unknown [Medicago truncatula]
MMKNMTKAIKFVYIMILFLPPILVGAGEIPYHQCKFDMECMLMKCVPGKVNVCSLGKVLLRQQLS